MMSRLIVCLLAAVCALPLQAAQHTFDFSGMATNRFPSNCFSLVGGEGKPGVWKVITDEVPLPIAPLSANAPSTAPKAVVAQLAWDASDEHFPMLVLGTNVYGDFTFTTKFKIVDGLTEQMAGVAFRIQDERNYYYVRASALGNTFYFFKIVKGVRSAPIGNSMKFEKGVWHELSVECSGPKIHILLDGQEALPQMSDETFSAGKVGFWTKSDSISYFTDARINYTPRETFAETLVEDMMKEYPHLLGLQVSMVPPQATQARLVASNNRGEIGEPGEKTDVDCISRGVNYYRKDKTAVYVTMPLRDRNGDTVAAVRVVMKKMPVQSTENALTRAMPVVKAMQERVSAVESIN